MGLKADITLTTRDRTPIVPACASALTALLLLGGCVRSEQSMYASFLNDGIDAERADDPALAMAFGLDEYEAPVLARADDH